MAAQKRSATDWRPRADVGMARRRSSMLRSIRDWFDARGVLDIDVPSISLTAVSDPNIESIEARPAVAGGRPAWLHTSPEYCMKRLLAAGFPDIYFLGKVFRDGEAGRRHQPEFTMIEWYRLGFGFEAIMADAETLLGHLLADRVAGVEVGRLDYRGAFRCFLDLDPFDCPIGKLAECAGADASLRAALGANRDAWLDLLMTREIAPRFPTNGLTTLYHYPASQAALARLSPTDPRIAERFEVFLGDVELANGYVELTDAAEQRRRFEADQALRRRSGLPVRPLDQRLLRAVDSGLPACAGVAAGFDRLLMLAAGATDIRDVFHFSDECQRDD